MQRPAAFRSVTDFSDSVSKPYGHLNVWSLWSLSKATANTEVTRQFPEQICKRVERTKAVGIPEREDALWGLIEGTQETENSS